MYKLHDFKQTTLCFASLFETRFHYVALAGLEPTEICLPLSLLCWDYRVCYWADRRLGVCLGRGVLALLAGSTPSTMGKELTHEGLSYPFPLLSALPSRQSAV